MVINLRRFLSDERFTLGAIVLPEFSCFSLELPWKNNKRNSSCIPIGKYKCSIEESPKFGTVVLVHGVIDRSGILIHPGNTTADSQGCIMVGGSLSLDSSNTLGASRRAFDRLLTKLRSQSSLELLVTFPWQFTQATSAK